jgi:hypothetical protein
LSASPALPTAEIVTLTSVLVCSSDIFAELGGVHARVRRDVDRVRHLRPGPLLEVAALHLDLADAMDLDAAAGRDRRLAGEQLSDGVVADRAL